jgi:hypothetical protein
MNRERPPLISIPTELGDETVAQLLELLYDLAGAIESQYAGQLLRYYQRPDEDNPGRQPSVLRDPPF